MMEDTQRTLPVLGLDTEPILNMYRESVDAWQKNFEALVQVSKPLQTEPHAAPESRSAREAAPAQLRKVCEDMFRRGVEQQIELCQFFQKRWEQYLSLPPDIAHCQSAADLTQVETAFFTKMAADYGIESRRVAETFRELFAYSMAALPAPFVWQKPANH